MNSNDLKIDISALCLNAYQMKGGYPYNKNIGGKHMFDLIMTLNDP